MNTEELISKLKKPLTKRHILGAEAFIKNGGCTEVEGVDVSCDSDDPMFIALCPFIPITGCCNRESELAKQLLQELKDYPERYFEVLL